MVDMIKKQIVPAVGSYINELVTTVSLKRSSLPDVTCELECELAKTLSEQNLALYRSSEEIEKKLSDLSGLCDMKEKAEFIRDILIPVMNASRKISDDMECRVSAKCWPFPTYSELLFDI